MGVFEVPLPEGLDLAVFQAHMEADGYIVVQNTTVGSLDIYPRGTLDVLAALAERVYGDG